MDYIKKSTVVYNYNIITDVRQDKTRQVYSANTMPGHQHTKASTHTCTHQTHLTTSTYLNYTDIIAR